MHQRHVKLAGSNRLLSVHSELYRLYTSDERTMHRPSNHLLCIESQGELCNMRISSGEGMSDGLRVLDCLGVSYLRASSGRGTYHPASKPHHPLDIRTDRAPATPFWRSRGTVLTILSSVCWLISSWILNSSSVGFGSIWGAWEEVKEMGMRKMMKSTRQIGTMAGSCLSLLFFLSRGRRWEVE